MKPNLQRPESRESRITIIEFMREHYDELLTLLRSGTSLEDLQYLAPLEELAELRHAPEFQTEFNTTDWAKLNAHICRKYYVTEISLWRAKKRLEREICPEI